MAENFHIRPETPADAKAVARVITAAFTGHPMSDGTEADLVARLRQDPAFVLALVAEKEGDIIGHIAFSEALISGEKVLVLAPLSVAPKWQDQGVGTALIKAAHQTLERLDYPAIVVLGHADYYARFGYEKAADYGINAPFDVPEEALRVRRLKDSPLPSGVIQYAAAFGIESF